MRKTLILQEFLLTTYPPLCYNINVKYRTGNGVRFVKSWEIGCCSWFPTFFIFSPLWA